MAIKQHKELPSVSEIIQSVDLLNSAHIHIVTSLIKAELSRYRQQANKALLTLKRSQIKNQILSEIEQLNTPSLSKVINGTGIVLHTGLGRAPHHAKLTKRVSQRLSGYVNLEFELESGKRGDRQSHLSRMISPLSGAESSLVVNNNAAAVLLALNTLAEGKEVIVSRGQQVEIGGSFRIPDVVRKSQCILKEVGTTNRTHLKDYKNALSKNTALILWVHTSNYVVKGFTHDVELQELVSLGRKKKIPVMADLGSGALVDLQEKGLPNELRVSDVVKTGVDVATFSGDKLLGGPQSGIIVGKSKWIHRIKGNPIHRAVRCDKWTIALLEEVFRTYESTGPNPDNLSLRLLTTSRATLRRRAEKVVDSMPNKIIKELGISIVDTWVTAGSGSLPEEKLESIALCFKPKNITAGHLAKQFRLGSIPIVGYTKSQRFYIDLKAVIPQEISQIAAMISSR